ncbi:hypothetical protein SAMN02910447_03233 [Ruminococcus sp. YE71]|uniref:hypothetical protein n=1 Tax=unclassified Ruminococcus TaxID=2608920 RepID=UPI0008900732|nr:MULTISPECIES: hypothetical protein [unclassified Ruminococcus]SDA30621.1 hypothetical protein SAMN02910446_03288 [Ruminococcus sp. YE78]SFW50081.1 hypothetical protein SAMN02910447_03233 [Ruminococcus sp. YE71]
MNIKRICEIAVKEAKELYDTDLDYTPESIDRLDKMLEAASQETPLSERRRRSIAVEFGFYLGETMLKNGMAEAGWEWKGAKVPMIDLELASGVKLNPVVKVYRRLCNGEEDEVKSFYNVGIAITKGAFYK